MNVFRQCFHGFVNKYEGYKVLVSIITGVAAWVVVLIYFLVKDVIEPGESPGHADILLYCTIYGYATATIVATLSSCLRIFTLKFNDSLVKHFIQMAGSLIFPLCLLAIGYFIMLANEPDLDSDRIEHFIQQLDSNNSEEQALSLYALGEFGQAAKDAIPKLRVLAESSPNANIRKHAILAIKRIEKANGE